MDKVKTKVISVEIGKFEVDSLTVILNDAETSICFDKKLNINQYLGKEVYLTITNGTYAIIPVETHTKK